MDHIKSEDNSKEVQEALERQTEKGLTAVALQAQTDVTKAITSQGIVDTGNLRASITYHINLHGRIKGMPYYYKGEYKKKHGSGGNSKDLSPKAKENTIHIGTAVNYALKQEKDNPKGAFLAPTLLNNKKRYEKMFKKYYSK